MSSRAFRVGRLLRIFLTMQARHLKGTVSFRIQRLKYQEIGRLRYQKIAWDIGRS